VLLRSESGRRHGRLYQASERFFDAMLDFYRRTLDAVFRHPLAIMVIFAVVLAVTVYVIIDLEYPRIGLIQMSDSDRVLVRLRESMK